MVGKLWISLSHIINDVLESGLQCKSKLYIKVSKLLKSRRSSKIIEVPESIRANNEFRG
jgi:hypothetical protein